MKKIFFVFIFIILSQNVFSQGIFPLNKGNLWQYIEPYEDYHHSTTIVGDSLLSNGKQYSFFEGNVFPSSFLRQSGSKVFKYNIYDSTESVMFDYSLNLNDTVSIHSEHGHQFVTILKDTGRIASSNLRWWDFVDYMVVTPEFSYDFATWTVLDSIGVIQVRSEPGYVLYLTGAKIDGVIRWGTITSVINENRIVPEKLILHQNYPNPFNNTTQIKYTLSKKTRTTLRIYDALGREIVTAVDEEQNQGTYIITLSLPNAASGVYFYRLSNGSQGQLVRKLLLTK